MRFGNWLLSVVILYWGCANGGEIEMPVVKYERSVIEVPDIPAGGSYRGQFWLSNTGGKPLRVTSVRSDCACTVSEMDRKEILPGDSALVRYTLTPILLGRFQQTIIVENNSRNEPSILFVIRSKVVF